MTAPDSGGVVYVNGLTGYCTTCGIPITSGTNERIILLLHNGALTWFGFCDEHAQRITAQLAPCQ